VDDIEEGRAYFEEAIALARATEDRYFLTQALVSWPVLFQESLQESICHLKEAHKIVMKLGNAGLREYVLQIYGRMEMIGGHYQSSEAMLWEALRLNQLLKDKHSTAHCLHILGRAATQQAQYEKAVRYEEQSLQIFQDLSDPGCLTLPILHLGWNAYLAGKPEVALEYLEKSLSRSYEFNFKAIRITSLTNLGYITAARWNLPTAKDRFLEAFELLKVQESSYQLAHALEMVCILPGLDVETVTQLLGKALAIREQNGFVLPVSEQQLVHPIIENVQSRLEEDAFNSVCAAGAGLTYQQTIDKAINALQSII
jgi:tetratricopeptide (TPR) repeat protein